MNKIICDKVSDWLLSYLEDNSLSSFVVGVSGGIDSAVVSTLCAKTGKPTIVLNIPINSKQTNTDLSTKHCDWLTENFNNVTAHNIDLSSVYSCQLLISCIVVAYTASLHTYQYMYRIAV